MQPGQCPFTTDCRGVLLLLPRLTTHAGREADVAVAMRETGVAYSPTVRGRRLAKEITRLRSECGLSMEAAADRLGWSASKVYRLENCRTRITTDDLTDMLDAYGASVSRRESLTQLCRDARRMGWWTAYADVFTGSYIAMEAEASLIRVHAHVVVPGLFQTPGYAHEIITATRPSISIADAARRGDARSARQQALFGRDDPPCVQAILDESALRREVGGEDVMRAQLIALTGHAARPDVTVQVLPFGAGANAGMDGKFTLLDFPEDPPVAYVEGLMGDVYLETPEETDRFRIAWTDLAQQALPPAESLRMIRALAKEKT